MESEPLTGVAMPHDMKAEIAQVLFRMIKPGEGRVEFLARILRKVRTIACDEAVFASAPLAEDVDRIVERGQGGPIIHTIKNVLYLIIFTTNYLLPLDRAGR